MDELVKFLTSKIGYTIIVVLGFIIPGAMFVFAWNRELYVELDALKLLVLSLGISFIMLIPNFFICSMVCDIIEKIKNKKYDMPFILFLSIFINCVEMVVFMLCKMWITDYSVRKFSKEVLVAWFWISCVLSIVKWLVIGLKKLIKSIKK